MAVTQQEIESRLWDAADELRVAMPEAQYSSVMFPLMFWKYLSDTLWGLIIGLGLVSLSGWDYR